MACATNTWCVSPSDYWEGSDGPWSTFAIQVGTPPTYVRVLPATSQFSVWTVLPDGCSLYSNAPADCPTLRGITFDPSKSSSFDYNNYRAVYDNGTYFQLPTQPEAGVNTNASVYDGAALVGFDAVRLGSSGNDAPALLNQTVACFATQNPFLGQLGLKAQNATISGFGDSHYSPLGYLNATGAVASSTYGYTAGSKNRTAFGSLTFGGFDASRGNSKNVMTSGMSEPSTKDLQLIVSGLRIGSTTVSAFPSAATYFIDSMVPEIWLPGNVCDQIMSVYGLIYDTHYEMYFIDTAQHANLSASNPPSLTFTLQALGNPSSTTQIEIPWFDLDHSISYPEAGINADGTSYSYFPIRRANTPDQYYLGRTFLQDAYLSVDYDKGTFNVSPALFPTPNSYRDIVSISNHQPSSDGSNHSSSGLSAGAIAGIAIGAAVAVALIAGMIFFYLRKRGQDRQKYSTATTPRPESMDGTTINNDARPDMGFFGSSPDQKTHSHFEHYKGPVEMNGEEQDQFKPELQGSYATREMSSSRHELYGSSIRRRSDQSRASISPLPRDETPRGRFRHLRQESDSSFGQPSPASLASSPPLGPEHFLGHPSPPMEMTGTFAGPFELHGGSRVESRDVTSTPAPTAAPTAAAAAAAAAAEPLLGAEREQREHPRTEGEVPERSQNEERTEPVTHESAGHDTQQTTERVE